MAKSVAHLVAAAASVDMLVGAQCVELATASAARLPDTDVLLTVSALGHMFCACRFLQAAVSANVLVETMYVSEAAFAEQQLVAAITHLIFAVGAHVLPTVWAFRHLVATGCLLAAAASSDVAVCVELPVANVSAMRRAAQYLPTQEFHQTCPMS